MIRVPSPLDDQTEKYLKEAMDCGFAVHEALGPGFFESAYHNAFCVELTEQKIPFERGLSESEQTSGGPVDEFRRRDAEGWFKADYLMICRRVFELFESSCL